MCKWLGLNGRERKQRMTPTIKTAFLTTFIQLPMLFWQYMFIAKYLHEVKNMDYLLTSNVLILAFMIGITFWVAYKSERINQHPWYIYSMVGLVLLTVIVFDSSWLAHVVLFLLSIFIYAWPLNRLFEKRSQSYEPILSSEEVIRSIQQGILASQEESKKREIEDSLKWKNLPDDDDSEVPN